jgi:hypothetical protein
MNRYAKRPLLIGGALLFGGCDDTPPNTPTLPDSGGGPAADSGNQQDAAAPMDTGSVADSGPLLDSGPPPADSGTPPHDSGAPPVAPNNGDACTDRGDAFCGRGQAQFFCTGTHWQLTENFDCRACDQGRVFTGYGSAACSVNAQAACAHNNQAWCDEQLVASMVCWSTWTNSDGMCDPCRLDQEGYLITSCATPGFIGLDRAGRIRQAGQSLRHL